MRDIKFRGKIADNSEWVQGYFLKAAGMIFISAFGIYEPILVRPETIGQYTGLKDKNGVEIYESDIVKLCDTNPVIFIVETILAPRSGYKFKWVYADDRTEAKGYFLDRCEVIGNVYDNSELLSK